MKKRRGYLAILLLAGILSACGAGDSEEAAFTPTGYPSGEVQQSTVYYNGTRYWYNAEGFDQPLEDGFEKVGEVDRVDNREYPSEEFSGTRLESGQEIYANREDASKIYVKYDGGYAVFERQEGSIQVHRAEEYHSLEEFRGHSEEGIFVLCPDAEADTQDNSLEAGSYNDQGLSAIDSEVIVEESYISVKYDCAYEEKSFDVWVFTQREGYEEGMRQEIKKMAGGSQPDILDMGEEKEPISYGGLGRIYGNIFGYWAVLDQKLVIVHIEEEEIPYVELVLGHLRWE